MGLHHTERQRAVARHALRAVGVGKELEIRGWTLFGYDPGESDPLTDYYRAASWYGAAVCEEEYPGVIACVQVAEYTTETRSGADGWPVFQATPKRRGWHIEKNGKIVETGLAYLGKCAGYSTGDESVCEVVTAIERAAERAMTAPTEETSQDGGSFDGDGLRVEYDRDWTWLFFQEKPAGDIREGLKSIGARWGRTRQGWYFRRRIERGELAWLLPDADESPHTIQTNEGVVPLILDDEGMDADPTGFEAGKGDAYDYIPAWMKVPPLYSNEKATDPLAVIKLFTPDANWVWFLTEYDGADTCFGLVVGHATELGYFSLSEIREVRGPLGLRIERDLWFEPRPITNLPEYQAEWGKHGGPYPGHQISEDDPGVGVVVKTTEELRHAQEKWPDDRQSSPNSEVVVLTSFDNGKQFGYDSERLGIWVAYRDIQGQRYSHGWTVWDNSQSDTPMPVPDPSYQGDGFKNLGDWSLAEALRQASEHFGVVIRLEGEPRWEDEYPHLADAPQQSEDEIQPWRMTRLAYQTMKAKVRVAGGVPILDAADGREHKRLVQEALERGEAVPERVRGEYPDLALDYSEIQDEELEGPVLSSSTEITVNSIEGPVLIPKGVEGPVLNGDEGQDRENYTDDQDRECYVPDEPDAEGPVLSETEGTEARLRKIWNEQGVLLARQEEILADIEMKASPEYIEAFFGNFFRPHEHAPLVLGKLYRDWLSVSGCKESADPSAERLAQYQQWAEELVTGGERGDGGAGFRRFCRVRLAGREAGMDLMTAGAAFQNGADCPAPEGWACLLDPGMLDLEGDTGEITPEDQAEFERWQLHLLTGMVGKKRSGFHQALAAISRPGTLRLALEQLDGGSPRRALVEARLAKLNSA